MTGHRQRSAHPSAQDWVRKIHIVKVSLTIQLPMVSHRSVHISAIDRGVDVSAGCRGFRLPTGHLMLKFSMDRRVQLTVA